MPTPITQRDMEEIFRVTDDLGIHREAVTVPLGKRDPGEVRRLSADQLRITLPESTPAVEWCAGPLREGLAELGYEELP